MFVCTLKQAALKGTGVQMTFSLLGHLEHGETVEAAAEMKRPADLHTKGQRLEEPWGF